jgi:hypothetical protein
LPIAHAVSPAPDGGYPGQNTAEGQSALLHLAGGTYNTALGWSSLGFNVTGNLSTGVGAATLLNNIADENTAIGAAALLSNTMGVNNTANGALALLGNTSGDANTATGVSSLLRNTTGTDNTASGVNALGFNITGNFNIGLGSNAGVNVTSASNVICIGADGNNVDNSCYIGNIFNATSAGGTPVYVNTNGRLGTSTSSRRFKEDIRPMNHASATLFSLKPVTFHYKKGVDPEASERKSEFGLVAEDVENVNPDLVVRDKEGKPYSVRYDQVNAMLLNEFLKEHRKVEKLQAALTAVSARLKEQDSKIERVSAQLELSRPAPQTVATTRK